MTSCRLTDRRQNLIHLDLQKEAILFFMKNNMDHKVKQGIKGHILKQIQELLPESKI
jgi:hypothetical protein